DSSECSCLLHFSLVLCGGLLQCPDGAPAHQQGNYWTRAWVAAAAEYLADGGGVVAGSSLSGAGECWLRDGGVKLRAVDRDPRRGYGEADGLSGAADGDSGAADLLFRHCVFRRRLALVRELRFDQRAGGREAGPDRQRDRRL